METKFVIEGLLSSGEWVFLAPVKLAADPQYERDEVVKILRDSSLSNRYSRVRLVKRITTTEIVGQEIKV